MSLICLKTLCPEDIQYFDGTQYASMSEAVKLQMLSESQAKEHEGRYFEVFAIHLDGTPDPVGFVSLYDRGPLPEGFKAESLLPIVGISPEIRAGSRNKGYATKAMKIAMDLAAEKGFREVLASVLEENTPSLALHRKLGFKELGRGSDKKGRLHVYFSYLL